VPVRNRCDRVLKPEEMRAIWHTLPDTDYGKLVKLLFYTACRGQEIDSLEWCEIDFDNAMLVIPAHKIRAARYTGCVGGRRC
jgi:integrase